MSWQIWPKACGKCGGDLTPESDMYGAYVKCLQCGTITHEVTKPCYACAVPERRAAHRLVNTLPAYPEWRERTAEADMQDLPALAAVSPKMPAGQGIQRGPKIGREHKDGKPQEQPTIG